MKILCLIDGLGSGGAQRQLVNLAVLLKKKHDITFTCYYDANFFEKQLTAEGIAIHWIKNKNALERIVKVRRFIKACDPDIVISYLETPNFLSCISAVGKHGWKVITNERSASEASFAGLKSKIFKWFERYSDWTVCNSYNAQRMRGKVLSAVCAQNFDDLQSRHHAANADKYRKEAGWPQENCRGGQLSGTEKSDQCD